jgi:uncharacterized protein YdhG (YjbR/CyaY superfamily)
MKKRQSSTISRYIAGFPGSVRAQLARLRAAIRKLVPGAKETIAYGIPTFVLNGNLVHFAGYKTHIGFYPTSTGISRFKKELARYHTSRGTVQFPLDKPLPLGLIRKIVRFRIKENLERAG